MISRMSSRRSQAQNTQGVFGYIIDPCDGQEPGGPPLLDHNEAGILETFFDNPSSLNPEFMSMHTSAQNTVGSHSTLDELNFGWMIEQSHLPPHAPIPNHHTSTSGQVDESYHRNQSIQHQLRNNNAPDANLPDDVYAAARLLQNSQNAQEQYRYPVMPQASAVNHEFTYNAPAQRTDNVQYADILNTINDSSTREKPLIFGTDEHFRASTYHPPKQSALDKTLQDSVQNFWSLMPQDDRQETNQPRVPRTNKKQKARSKTPEAESGGSSNDSESGGNQGKSPRKKKARGDEDGGSITKSGKRRQSTIQSKSKKAGISSNVKTASKDVSSGLKGPRENLTEEQKRSNHIQSEQKRRNLIKQGFEDLNRMVPKLRSGGLSKSNMLMEATKFLRQLKDDNDILRAALDSSQ